MTYALFALSKVVPGVLLLIAVPLWLRTFGVEQYGVYATIWGVAAASTSLATGWIRQSTLRSTGLEGRDVPELPRWTVPTAAIIGAVPAAVVALYLAPHSTTSGALLAVTAGAFSVTASTYGVRQAHSQRHMQVGRFAAAEIVRAGVALGLSLIIFNLFPRSGAVAILGAYTIGNICATGLLGPYRRVLNTSRVEPRTVLRDYWTFGWPMSLWLGVSAAMLYLDRFAITVTLGSEEAGRYAAIADIIVRGVGMVAYPITMNAHPRLMHSWNTGSRSTMMQLRRYLLAMTAAGAICVLGTATAGPALLGLILGVQEPSVGLVVPLVVGGVLWQAALLTHKPLELEGRTRTMLYLICFSTAASLAVNFALLSSFGPIVAAYAFCGASAGYVASTSLFARRLRKTWEGAPQ